MQGKIITIGLTILGAIGVVVIAPKTPPPPPPDFEDVDKADDLLRMLQQIADKRDIAARVLTPWEINFATEVAGRYSHDYDLSEKQLVVVQKILLKAKRVFP